MEQQETWQQGFRRAFWKYFSTHARIGAENAYGDGFSYEDPDDMWDHMKRCEVDDSRSTFPEASEWSVFNGTSAPWTPKYGLDAQMTCRCGSYEDMMLRIEANASELILGILKEEDA